jgi:hypothetical protein
LQKAGAVQPAAIVMQKTSSMANTSFTELIVAASFLKSVSWIRCALLWVSEAA